MTADVCRQQKRPAWQTARKLGQPQRAVWFARQPGVTRCPWAQGKAPRDKERRASLQSQGCALEQPQPGEELYVKVTLGKQPNMNPA